VLLVIVNFATLRLERMMGTLGSVVQEPGGVGVSLEGRGR